MISIRLNTFETNSSSAHCLIYCSKVDFEKFQKDEMILVLGCDSAVASYFHEKEPDYEDNLARLVTFEDALGIFKQEASRVTKYGNTWWNKEILQFFNVKSLDEITVEAFKKAVLTRRYCWGSGTSQLYDFYSFDRWEDGYTDYVSDDPHSTWKELDDGRIELSTNYRNG